MPYFISKIHPDCDKGWAVVTREYELVYCTDRQLDARIKMNELSREEGIYPGGIHPNDGSGMHNPVTEGQ